MGNFIMTTSVKLSELLSVLELQQMTAGDVEITDITCDSRKVKPGTLFVALPGARMDGHDFIPAAVRSGAAAIVAQRPVDTGSVPLILTAHPRQALALLSAAFFGHPARQLTLIGLTGTKGKTTTAHIIQAILQSAGHKTAMIGTVGYFIGTEKVADAVNTTPESVDLHRFFARAVREGCTHLVMEVSSQALKLHRTAGILFDAALFLNLSPDHIGGAEHRDFDEYRACKAMLFQQCRYAIANGDDPHFHEIFHNVSVPVETFGFSAGVDVRGSEPAPLRGEGLLGSRFSVTGYDTPVQLNMPGLFNVSDALAAIALARRLGIPETAVRRGLMDARVRGRTEIFPHRGGTVVLIDYAHNDVSFASLLSTLKEYDHDRLLVVFGAGGDRPRMRRTDMAREAAKYADFAVITADNPRTECVEDICADITAGLEGKIPSVEIYDRAEAIRYALDHAGERDIVALLGKGHEEYIEVNGVRSHFSEKEVLADYYARRESHSPGQDCRLHCNDSALQ